MKQEYQAQLRHVISIAHSLLQTYDQLQRAPANSDNPAIAKEAEWVQRWLALLEGQVTRESIDEVWREVQPMAYILDGRWEPEHLSRQKARLTDEFFEAMFELMRQARKAPS